MMSSNATVADTAHKLRKKPRLFWIMMTAFMMVIMLGICGMLGLIGLTVAGIWRPDQWHSEILDDQHTWTPVLADYYRAHGESWAGVEQRLADLPTGRPFMPTNYILVDDLGRVVASNARVLQEDQMIGPELLASGTPIVVNGQQVGVFILRPGTGGFQRPQAPDFPPPPAAPRRSASLFWPVLRGFLFAGLGLGLMLLLLAVIFVRRIVRPLRTLTAATQAMAAGQLDVQVPGASVRELDELARSFNRMAQSLAQADLQRRQMTADIAHELRTPLTIIKGRLEGLQDGVYSATPDQVGLLLNETALLERLIEDLRLLALAEAGQLPLFREILDPLDLLHHIKASFAGHVAEHQVELQVEASDDLPEIDVDPQRILQVLGNLVSNALRHTAAGGKIILRAAPSADLQSGRVVLQVTDTGQGIAVEDLPHIFDRFWRADRSRTRGSGGAGLGLAIARQIVVAHGGAIWAESRPDQGTTINIELPAAAHPIGSAEPRTG